ncbi:MAG: Transcriptional regulator, PadR family [uncultured Solirubrobacteraceae bacterium]|uniref:Transcriptional regulator, PadR family n=1 Tax=uncultured Solirubrobacteraceae bacterium TaxID=1162706 RepID=A0A6J4SV77_9ACTN|nr:MAG: Transcriptional regulator, PadR family [uncultured Solirubrobacteraceae bacterium]
MRHARHCGHGRLTAEAPFILAMAGAHRGESSGPWGWGGFGPGSGFGPHRGGPHRRGRRSRGDVRAAILLLLDEEPRNGYGLMQEVEQRSSGAWRPSSGSIYPALAQLEDEGLIVPAEAEQGKAFQLTDAGREYVAEHRGRIGVPWEAATEGMPDGLHELRNAAGQLGVASLQVAQTGDPQLIAGARQILEDARKAVYRLLAGDHEGDARQ